MQTKRQVLVNSLLASSVHSCPLIYKLCAPPKKNCVWNHKLDNTGGPNKLENFRLAKRNSSKLISISNSISALFFHHTPKIFRWDNGTRDENDGNSSFFQLFRRTHFSTESVFDMYLFVFLLTPQRVSVKSFKQVVLTAGWFGKCFISSELICS